MIDAISAKNKIGFLPKYERHYTYKLF